MALPILNNASLHELTVPSTGKTHNYRPYLVKEEKILLQAKESNDDKLMMRSLTKLIESCVEDINTNELTTFDVEYIFLILRGKSSGEIIKVGYNCIHCEAENDVEVNLANIKNSIISVNTETERTIFADESMQDQDAFIDSLSSAQFQKITDFITNGPAVVYEDDITCTSCKEVFKIELRGMASFF